MSLKDFQIQNKLGSGSFGIVYKSRRKQTNEILVLKQVELKRMDKRMRQWALNEAKIMKNVNSPHIVKYYQSFTEKEKLYIAMEYCSGGDLCQFLKGQMGKPLSEDTVWKFTLQIMLGLRDLHAKKILHRDIKTMNVFLTENRTVRIGDLGVARTMTGDFASTVVGTPYYLSPEMCEEKPYNEKTDVWAMGCLVYELCTGKHPFEANTQAALALKIVVGKYAPIPAQYSQTLVWLVRLCLSVDYKRRPSIEYLLGQQAVADLASKYGICLEKQKENAVEKQPEGKEVKGESKEQGKVTVVQKPVVPIEKIEKQPPAKKNEVLKKQGSVERIKERSIERAKEKMNQKEAKKQYKPIPPPANKFLPPKEKTPQQQLPKKVEGKEKPFVKLLSAQTPKQVQIKPIVKPLIEPPKGVIKPKEKIEEAPIQKEPSSLLLESKPRKSAQELVDDDELFKDFGITPEKLTTLGEKMDFKKVNTINWNIHEENEEKPLPSPTTAGESEFLELPTIKTPSNCEIVPVDCKQPEEEEVAEEMDDNVPYRSSSEGSLSEAADDALLLEEMPEIEEEGELRRKESLLLLERKIFENERRRKELSDLKEQYEREILQRVGKAPYERIKAMIREDRDVDSLVAKELSGGNVLKLIKIYHYEIEIVRCEQNVAKWREKASEVAGSERE